jgi:hypothetical protein
MRAFLVVLVLVFAVFGVGLGLWRSHDGHRKEQPPSSSRPVVGRVLYCIEDQEDGHWIHYEARTKAPSGFEPGPCPAHSLYDATP